MTREELKNELAKIQNRIKEIESDIADKEVKLKVLELEVNYLYVAEEYINDTIERYDERGNK